MKLYSIFDKKASVYGAIMMAPNDAMMARSLVEHTPPQSTLMRFAEDFDLYEVGEFSDDTGRVSEQEVRFICNVSVLFQRKAE